MIQQHKVYKNMGEGKEGVKIMIIFICIRLCILYIYMPLLELELYNMKQDWNNHRIRLQKRTDRPSGVPNELFDFPELKGTVGL